MYLSGPNFRSDIKEREILRIAFSSESLSRSIKYRNKGKVTRNGLI